MARKDGQQVVLTRHRDGWMADEKYKVMPVKINVLLSTIRKLKVDYPVPKIHSEKIVEMMKRQHTLVKIYSEGKTKPEEYFLGMAAKDGVGCYALTAENGVAGNQPYVLKIPGFENDPGTRFFTKNLDWRDLSVFRYSINQIKNLKVEYAEEKESSFEIVALPNDSFQLKRIHSLENDPIKNQPHQPWIEVYLDYFKLVSVESYENGYTKKDSVLMAPPFAWITVTNKKDEVRHIELYYKSIDRRSKSKFTHWGEPLRADLDRYFAVTNDGKDFAIVQDYVFRKLFRRYKHFFKNEPPG